MSIIPEALAEGESLLGPLISGGEKAVASEAPSAVEAAAGAGRDSNDSFLSKVIGSKFGKTVRNDLAFHGATSLLGGGGGGGGGGGQQEAGPPTGGVDIGSWGNV
jgi:hypothetical protein